MEIVQKPVSEIKPYDRNPRVNDGAVAALVASIREFGFRQPIVVDADMVIIVGHTRLKAAIQLGMKMVPVHIARDLTPAQVKALRIADNQTGSISQWNFELLPLELNDLEALEFDLSLLGFEDDELLKIRHPEAQAGECDPDEIPVPPDEPITQPGDLWILGNHRLLCGNSSNPDELDRLLGGQPIHIVNTDPPYNVKVEPRSGAAIAAGNSSFTNSGKKGPQRKLRAKDRPLANDFVTDEAFDQMLDAWFGNIARVLLPGRALYAWGGYSNCANYPIVLKRHGLYFSQAIIWVKEHPVMTRKDFMGNHEWCFYCWKEGSAHVYLGPRNITDVWSVKKIPPQQMEHLTAKPAELAVRALQYSSRPGENVLDLFGGSGSTLIGAQQTGRNAFLMEIDPPYCDVIADRFQRFTGVPAVLERTGTSPIPMRARETNMR